MSFLTSALIVLILVVYVDINKAYNLQLGKSVNSELAHHQFVNLWGIPFVRRIEDIFYADELNRTLKGISATDMDNSTCRPTVTSGGVGFTFANVRLRSERGRGIYYQVQFFV